MAKTTKTPRKTLLPGIGKVLKRLHYPLDVMLLCVRWCVAYSLSLRNLLGGGEMASHDSAISSSSSRHLS